MTSKTSGESVCRRDGRRRRRRTQCLSLEEIANPLSDQSSPLLSPSFLVRLRYTGPYVVQLSLACSLASTRR